ncbi:LacI family transcriptional regulator [bacterium]|nr:MAG: LacI family transcriptional regulator [bacterium]
MEDSDYVYSNLQPAVEEALETMFAAGRQRIAFAGIGVVGKTLSTSDPEVRTHTYSCFMERVGRQPEFISASFSYEVPAPERVAIVREYIEEHGCPDAILCVNDDVATQVYRALMDLGRRIPEDVLLVGCDGLPVLQYFEPPISTISQPLEQICATAWRFLQARMADPNRPLQQESMEARLVATRSLGISS